jgi:hypothetical protein
MRAVRAVKILKKAALKKEEIERNIRKREKNIAATGKLFSDKPSLQDSLKYLETLGVKVNKMPSGEIVGLKNQPMKGIVRCRPQFKPDGKLLTVTNSN